MKYDRPDGLLQITADIAAAYLSFNRLTPEEVPPLIASAHETLTALLNTDTEPARPAPAVPINNSITPDYIVCLEDGRKLKMLKRYLRTAFDLTPEQYRARWGLPSDYPMVAPNYAERRSNLAKQIGLGTKAGRGR